MPNSHAVKDFFSSPAIGYEVSLIGQPDICYFHSNLYECNVSIMASIF